MSTQIAALLEKNETVDKFMATHFKIDSMTQDNIYERNMPSYQNAYHNFKDFMVTLRRKDWKDQIKIKQDNDYYSSVNTTGRQITPIDFQDSSNMQQFFDANATKLKTEHNEKLQALKQEINQTINALYEEVATAAMSMDKFRVPIHGIPYPEAENPVNLFQRQLKIEQLSFDLAHSKYKNQMESLMRQGLADQVATSHRYILEWMRLLEQAIIEQQKIATKRGTLDHTKIGYYLMAMPGDQIATICVLHLVRHLFKEFVEDLHKDSERASNVREIDLTLTSDVKIPAVTLFDELGRLFDKELKIRITDQKKGTAKSKH